MPNAKFLCGGCGQSQRQGSESTRVMKLLVFFPFACLPPRPANGRTETSATLDLICQACQKTRGFPREFAGDFDAI